ncbi:MFS family transporter [Methylobacterium oryzisoli]|uniref:MFS family transporter n=1 Tax=Methylobacterium oryzisoli TaxID=3385502 RepID=UPI0038916B03
MAEGAIIGSTTDLSEAEKQTPRGRIASITGACAGNLVEWFDFFVYAYTAIYFASAFFPAGDQTSQLLSTAGVFAVGFFMRPLGGWIFGKIADRRGRKISMMISVAMMCGGSLLIAILPTFQTIGVLAPVLLVLARMLQGLSVGAEYGTGATYLSEVSSAGRRGFYGSFQYFTIVAGQLLALLTVTALQHALDPVDLKAWGWRIPFFLGACGAVVVAYLRRAMTETASKKAMHHSEAGTIAGLMKHKRAVLLTLAFTGGGSLYFYTFTTYMQKFLVVSAGISSTTVSFIMTSALVCFMLAQPLFGMLSDRIGIRPCMILFTGGAALTVVPILTALRTVGGPFEAFLLVVAGLLVACFYTPIAGLVKAELFPAEVRALGVGLPYAIANAMFGGTAEYVALHLRSVNNETAFFYYAAAMALVALATSLTLPHLGRHGYLDGDGAVEANARPRLSFHG